MQLHRWCQHNFYKLEQNDSSLQAINFAHPTSDWESTSSPPLSPPPRGNPSLATGPPSAPAAAPPCCEDPITGEDDEELINKLWLLALLLDKEGDIDPPRDVTFEAEADGRLTLAMTLGCSGFSAIAPHPNVAPSPTKLITNQINYLTLVSIDQQWKSEWVIIK